MHAIYLTKYCHVMMDDWMDRQKKNLGRFREALPCTDTGNALIHTQVNEENADVNDPRRSIEFAVS